MQSIGMPSAAMSAVVISCNLSTRTLVTSSVIRLAHLGMWIEGRHLRQ